MNPVKMDGDQMEIPISKLKVTLLFFISIVFVIGGIEFIIHPKTFTDSGLYHRPGFEILLVGYVCVIFFGAGAIIAIVKLVSNKPGLLIDNKGITINPGSFSKSFIEWSSIENFGIKDISRTKMIMVYLKNPEEFISQLNNNFKRKMALFSLKTYGTPISITTSSLKCNTDELYTLLTNKLNK